VALVDALQERGSARSAVAVIGWDEGVPPPWESGEMARPRAICFVARGARWLCSLENPRKNNLEARGLCLVPAKIALGRPLLLGIRPPCG